MVLLTTNAETPAAASSIVRTIALTAGATAARSMDKRSAAQFYLIGLRAHNKMITKRRKVCFDRYISCIYRYYYLPRELQKEFYYQPGHADYSYPLLYTYVLFLASNNNRPMWYIFVSWFALSRTSRRSNTSRFAPICRR